MNIGLFLYFVFRLSYYLLLLSFLLGIFLFKLLCHTLIVIRSFGIKYTFYLYEVDYVCVHSFPLRSSLADEQEESKQHHIYCHSAYYNS